MSFGYLLVATAWKSKAGGMDAMRGLIRKALTVVAVVSLAAVVGCSSRNEDSYEQQYARRIDEIITRGVPERQSRERVRPEELFVPVEPGGGKSARGRLEVFEVEPYSYSKGEEVRVAGRMTAVRKTEAQEVQEVLIWDGQTEFQLSSDRTREELAQHLGSTVELRGTVAKVNPGSIILDVDNYNVIGVAEQESK